MQTIPDITVDATEWIDLNTASDIAVGTKMTVTLKTVTWCRLYEGDTAPDLDTESGILLTDLNKPYAVATIPADSLKIWALCAVSGRSAKLALQEV